jgi:hypothetical protein
MPDFVVRMHDRMIENYISSGVSKFFSTTHQVFYSDNSGIIWNCTIRLANLFETTDDYIINASIIKEKTNMNYLLFDEHGRIIGISKELFSVLKDKTSLTIQTLYKKCYVFFWI